MTVVRSKLDYKRIPWTSFETWGMRRPTKSEANIISKVFRDKEIVLGKGYGFILLDVLLMLYGIIYGVLTFGMSQGALMMWCAPAFAYGLADLMLVRYRVGRCNNHITRRKYMCQSYELYRVKYVKYNSSNKCWVAVIKLRYFDGTTGSDYEVIMPQSFANNKKDFEQKIRQAKFIVVYIAKNQYYRVIPTFSNDIKVIDELD